ncbi:MAG: uracil DNA glycosylase [Caeruleum heppii]|nr:MAG: uracil DNA glycosylase [Caeruleum heppii]
MFLNVEIDQDSAFKFNYARLKTYKKLLAVDQPELNEKAHFDTTLGTVSATSSLHVSHDGISMDWALVDVRAPRRGKNLTPNLFGPPLEIACCSRKVSKVASRTVAILGSKKLFIDEEYLAAIPGVLILRGVDAQPDEPECIIQNGSMLFDTGAHTFCITDDMLPESFTSYLDNPIHDPYRGTLSASVKVQVSATVAIGKQPPLNIDCVFTVVKKASVPNKRSGIILGQCSLLDRLQYHVLPGHVLRARGDASKKGIGATLC